MIQLEPEDPSFSIPRPIILDHLGPETLPYSLCTVTGWYIPPRASLFFEELVQSSLNQISGGYNMFVPFKRNQLFVGSGFVLDALLGTFLRFVMCFSFLKIFLSYVERKLSFCPVLRYKSLILLQSALFSLFIILF